MRLLGLTFFHISADLLYDLLEYILMGTLYGTQEDTRYLDGLYIVSDVHKDRCVGNQHFLYFERIG